VNPQTKSIKIASKTNHFCIFVGFVYDFIDFVCEFTVEIIEHTVASYKTCDFS
jgi:hypothetical protein